MAEEPVSKPEKEPESEISLAQRVKIEALQQGVRVIEFSPNDCRRLRVLRGADGTFKGWDKIFIPHWGGMLANPKHAFSIAGNRKRAGDVEDILRKLGTFTKDNPRLFKGKDSQLTFRAVAAPHNREITADEMVRGALQNGGKDPDDTGVGSWFADNSKVDEYFEGAFTGRDVRGPSDYVLFIYDKDKLIPLTDEEIGSDAYARHWRLKPKSGGELKDCLVGAIIFRGERAA